MAETPKESIEQAFHEALVLILNGFALAHGVKISTINADWVDCATPGGPPLYRVYRLAIHTESTHL